jgi:hypothetical protein
MWTTLTLRHMPARRTKEKLPKPLAERAASLFGLSEAEKRMRKVPILR